MHVIVHCAHISHTVQFQKISILPPQKGFEFPGGQWFCNAKKCKEMYEAWNFQRGLLEKIPTVGEVWIFFGIVTHYDDISLHLH